MQIAGGPAVGKSPSTVVVQTVPGLEVNNQRPTELRSMKQFQPHDLGPENCGMLRFLQQIPKLLTACRPGELQNPQASRLKQQKQYGFNVKTNPCRIL